MSPDTHRFHVALPNRQWVLLQSVSLQTQVSVSEIVRGMVEVGLAEPRLNDAFPTLSGTLVNSD